MHLWMFGLLDLSECQAKCFRISSTNAITYNSNVTFCHIPEGHLKFLWQLDTRATSADGYQREWSSYCDSPDKLARPLSGCASSRSVADLAPWGWRTSQWLDGWLVLASEQKESAVFKLPINHTKGSSCISFHRPAGQPSTTLLGPLQQAWTNHLDIWDITSIIQLVRGGGLTSGMSCLGYVCRVLMGQEKLIHSYRKLNHLYKATNSDIKMTAYMHTIQETFIYSTKTSITGDFSWLGISKVRSFHFVPSRDRPTLNCR